MNKLISSLLLAGVTLLVMQPAMAHHPLGGLPMETFSQGLLSGIGHPLLGIDHLFFFIAAGILALHAGYALTAPPVLIIGVVVGVLINVAGVQVPANEFLIAISLLALGSIGLFGKKLTLVPLLLLFGGLGVVHGWAFGQTIVQQESAATAVLAGYLIGLAVVQWAIAVSAGGIIYRGLGTLQSFDIRARLSCAIVTGVGVTYLLEHIESIVL